MAGSPEICVDALWFKVPDCTCHREHEEVSILVKFGVHQVLLLHHDSIEGMAPGLEVRFQKWKKGHSKD